MRIARQLLVVFLGVTVICYPQGNTFEKIRYNGGTIQTDVSPKDWKNRLTVTPDLIRLELKDRQVLEIDPALVSGLSYGQEAHRRVGTMVALGVLLAPLALFGLFHKTRLHYIGIEFTTPEGKKSGLLLQAHKNNFRAVLMALRGATGAPVAVSEEDRKYVPTGVEVVVAEAEERKAETAQDTQEERKPTQAEPGICHVTSTPELAEVWVDGTFVGSTPAKLTLTPGKHHIRLSLSGYQDWVREIEVLPDSEVKLNAVLQEP